MPQSQQAKCVRCGQPLLNDSAYCTSCGHADELLLKERKLKSILEADKRIGFWQWLREHGWFWPES